LTFYNDTGLNRVIIEWWCNC